MMDKSEVNTKTPEGERHEDFDVEVGRLVEEITDRLLAEPDIDLKSLAEQYPQYSEQIEQLLPSMQLLVNTGATPVEASQLSEPIAPSDELRPHVLGDYRIIREIARGGMGVVYEAEQVSLGRPVALKVLPFAAVLDPRQLQRFKNEAQAAAMLDHPNIVGVHAVGCERGVHYYAMQYIEGQTLAQVIGELQQVSGADETGGADNADAVSRLTRDLTTGQLVAERQKSNVDDGATELTRPPAERTGPSAETKREPQARISTVGPNRGSEFFRSVAQLGIQAAEALEHAHEMGVVHRDIKPSNLMVDARGHLWIADFGLAMTQTDANLTMTGDVLGTLRYMSPENRRSKQNVPRSPRGRIRADTILPGRVALPATFGIRSRRA